MRLPRVSVRRVGISLVGLLIFFVFTERSHAGSIGDPTASGRAGLLSEINLEYDSTERDVSGSTYSGSTHSDRILVQGIYGLSPFTDIYLRAGAADFQTTTRGFDGNLGPAFGGGVRWTLLQRGDLRIGFGVQALQFFSHASGSASSRLSWTELESFLGGDLQGMERFTPYFGLSISKAVGKVRGGANYTVRSSDLIGVFVGAELQIYKNYYFSGEARIISESSLTIRLNYHL